MLPPRGGGRVQRYLEIINLNCVNNLLMNFFTLFFFIFRNILQYTRVPLQGVSERFGYTSAVVIMFTRNIQTCVCLPAIEVFPRFFLLTECRSYVTARSPEIHHLLILSHSELAQNLSSVH